MKTTYEFLSSLWKNKDLIYGLWRKGNTTNWKWFFLGDFAPEYIEDNNENSFFTINGHTQENNKKESVACLNALYVDWDCGTDPKPVYELFETVSIHRPSYTIISGRGLHFYWKLNNKENTSKAENLLYELIGKALSFLCGGDKTFNCNRLSRLPNSLNKGVRVTVIEDNSDKSYSLEDDFGNLLRVLRVQNSREEMFVLPNPSYPLNNLSAQEAIESIPSLKKAYYGYIHPPNDFTRSGWEMMLISRLVFCPLRYFSDEEILQILETYPCGRQDRDGYLTNWRYSIKKAREKFIGLCRR